MLVDISFPGLGNTIVKVTRDRWFLHINYINYCYAMYLKITSMNILFRRGTEQ